MADTPSLLSGCDILLLEDDPTLRKRLAAYLTATGAEVTSAGRLAEARRLLADVSFDYALIDLHLPDGEGLDLLREKAFSETTGVVVMTAFGSIAKAVEAIKLGAGDYLSKPFEPEAMQLAFARCRTAQGATRRDEQSSSGAGETDALFFGDSLAHLRTQLDAILAAERRLQQQLPPVLIEGETGTGKSALARWLHRQGPRAGRPLVAVNCATLPDSLADAELFGHERGAFTDAKRARVGLFEAAHQGTLFLDEIASLSPATQAKVLTAIEENTIRRLGGTKQLQVDVRVIAASNQPVEALVQAGRFREDLFQRLHLLHVVLPPLRERGTDILRLADHLLHRIATRHGLKDIRISEEGKSRLLIHPWRGNVRELAHELERAVIFSTGPDLHFAHLGPAPSGLTAEMSWRNPGWRLPPSGFTLDDVVTELVNEALRETNQNVSAAARRLGVTREYLRYRLSGENGGAKTETDSG